MYRPITIRRRVWAMIKPRKAIAYFTLYNIVSVLVFAFSLGFTDESTIDYYGILAGAYLGIGILSIMMALAVLAINEIHK
jgi:hypothetical protein